MMYNSHRGEAKGNYWSGGQPNFPTEDIRIALSVVSTIAIDILRVAKSSPENAPGECSSSW